MKQITALLFLILLPVILFGQILQNAYEVEEKGYLRSPKQTEHGIVATNNYRSEIYLIEDGQKTTLVSSSGAGLYNTLSPDRSQLGFKSINEEGLQAPAVVDLRSGETRLLHDYVTACGQPSFFGESGYAFTIDQNLMVYESAGEPAQEFDLQEYANIAPVSPDGRYVVYNDMDDVLHLRDLSDQSVEKISATGYASYGPVWSYDSKKIAYMTNGGELFVYSLPEQQNYSMGKGKDPDWFEDSEKLVFTRYETEQFQLKSIHVVESRYDGSMQVDLTDPESTAANDASVTPANEVLYYDLLHREINRIEKQNDQIEIRKKYRLEDQNDSPFKPVPDNGSEIQDSDIGYRTIQDGDASLYIDNVPFVNQVWDTPQISGNNYNYAACAPATASMAIGYFERVPHWPSTHYQNTTRNYANYVAKEYTAFGHTYNTVSRGVKGGMGFMWHSGHGSSGSPRTTMAKYINQHDLESIQSWSLSYADMVKELQDGNPYPLCVMLTSAGHLILAIGIEDDSRRTVIVNDPYGDKNVQYPSYNGINVVYDWPGYNYGNMNLESVPWAVTARGDAGEDQPVTDRPDQFLLAQNYPNPFNSTTRIRYDLPRNAEVQLEVFNITGRRVAVLVNEHRPAGTHEVIFDAGILASGAYIYRIQAGGFVKNRQMMFIK